MLAVVQLILRQKNLLGNDDASQPLHGVRSKTPWINAVYAVTAPLLSWMVRATPNYMTTSEQLGRAMIKVARDGYPKPILESADINAV